jgi:hypothetical protein
MQDGNHKTTSMQGLLGQIGKADHGATSVTFADILEVVGNRSFGPLLLLAGFITLAPLIGDIPGVPTLTGLFIILISVQMLLGRRHFWLPRLILDRSINRKKLKKVLDMMQGPSRFIDRLLSPRLTALVEGPMTYAIAIICACIALIMPVMEIIPFSANLAGGAITAYGLALFARDGVAAIFAFVFTAAILGLAIYKFI